MATAKKLVQEDIEAQEAGEREPLLKKTKAPKTFIEKALNVSVDKKFVEDFDLALRGATGLLIIAIPFLIPKGTFEFLDQVVSKGAYSSSAAVYFLITLGKTTGVTVNNAYGGIVGTTMATLNIWLLFGIFPTGVTATSSSLIFWVGIVHGSLFVFMFLWLNVNICTSIYAIATFVWYWMEFLDANEDAFNKGFALSLDGAAVRGLIACFTGATFAILATLLPTPLWAIQRARDQTKQMAVGLCQTWDDFTTYYCAETRNVYVENKVNCALLNMQSAVLDMEEHLASSWWECFGFGRRQQARASMQSLAKTLHLNIDRLMATCNICMCENFEPEHAEFASRIKAHTTRVVDETSTLLRFCVDASCDGLVSDAEVADIRTGIRRVQTAAVALATEFRAATQASESVDESTLDEHVFCLSVSSFSSFTREFAEELIESRGKASDMIEPSKGVISIFDISVLFEGSHLGFTFRNTLSILIGFFIGYHGFGEVLPQHNAAIAGTCAVLLAKFVGSSLKNNLMRIQGVVIGTAAGQLGMAIFGTCGVWARFTMAVAIFFMALTALFIKYNATLYAPLGAFMAVMGTSQMLGGCRTGPLDSHLAYHTLVSIVVATAIMIIIDFVFQPARASNQAYTAFVEAWKKIDVAMRALFDKTETKVGGRSTNTILQAIVDAETLGQEAAQEPRYWRNPWKEEAFNLAIRSAHFIRVCMTAVESGVSAEKGGEKNELFISLLRMPSGTFGKVSTLTLEKVSLLHRLLLLFVHEMPGPIPAFQGADVERDHLGEQVKSIRQVLAEVSRDGLLKQQQSASKELQWDPTCQFCLVITSLNKIMAQMRELQKGFIKAA